MKWKVISGLSLSCVFAFSAAAQTQHSVARQWNEVLLEAIRNDFARPTIHARNLFHVSAAMYDAWAAYDSNADTDLLAHNANIFTAASNPADLQAAREEAISFAAYRLLKHRFQNSPGAAESLAQFDLLFAELGYDSTNTSTNYSSGSPAAWGNFLAQHFIDTGLKDGSNERNDYANKNYEAVNPPLIPMLPGNPYIVELNRWQPLSLEVFIDQAGYLLPVNTPEFLCPEWGAVTPFALTQADLRFFERDGYNYWIYHDPGDPPYLDTTHVGGLSEEYKWGFSLVSIWSAHLDPTDGAMLDISPASIGNNPEFPQTIEGYRDFYSLLEGGDPGSGHAVNPFTGQPYQPQVVPRGDYARVLAEFWADGPHSETPPGHWFTILNYVNDHPLFEKRFRGQGPVLDDLEWDIKAYFIMGGAVHDAAIAAWGIKGWYDYIRPISAIRCMADRGQSSDPNLPRYDPGGILLVDDFIEMVAEGDPLAGDDGQHIGKIKLFAWRGHDYIDEPETDVAGVGWILAENWWPYQRPSFVTPPFAGYVSGHSTFSRAGAEVMTLLTGDAYFPGGLGEFYCKKNEFLVFEEGPSVDLTLQWATYRDASDQCSLSRIWGGIHPPADDIPGRRMGEKIGVDAFTLAERYFSDRSLFYLEEVAVDPESPTNPSGKMDLYFEEVAADRGIPTIASDKMGQGISAADVDNDGDIDLFIPNMAGTACAFLVNQGDGTFLNKAPAAGLDDDQGVRSALWFDYNNDGRLDLLTTNDVSANTSFKLFRQEDGVVFAEVTRSAGLAIVQQGVSLSRGGLCAADIDNDGDLDFYAAIWTRVNQDVQGQLFQNNGDETFTDISDPAGVRENIAISQWQPTFFDFDEDGWMDLHQTVDFGNENRLWMNNQDGTFTDISVSAGVNNAMDDMGTALGDYNNDGKMDIFVTNIFNEYYHEHNILLRNETVDGNVAFTEVATSLGVDDGGWGWGCTFFDADNDGWIDLAATNGSFSGIDSTRFYRNRGGPPNWFTEDLAEEVGIQDFDWGVSLIAVDMDRDGRMDLMQTTHNSGGLVRLWENRKRLFRGAPQDFETRNYLVIQPRQGGGNQFAIGAIVRATTSFNQQMRYISAGTSVLAQEPAEAHFGLGPDASADIEVQFPNGDTQRLEGIAGGGVVQVSPGPLTDLRQGEGTWRTGGDIVSLFTGTELWLQSTTGPSIETGFLIDSGSTHFDVTLNSRYSGTPLVGNLQAFRWSTGEFEDLDTWILANEDSTKMLTGVDAAKYMNASGRVLLRVRTQPTERPTASAPGEVLTFVVATLDVTAAF